MLLQGMPEFDKRSTDDRAEGTHQPLCVHHVVWEEDVFDVGYACSPVTQGVMANVLDSTTWRAALQGAHDVVLQAPARPATLIALARHSSALQTCGPTMCRWTSRLAVLLAERVRLQIVLSLAIPTHSCK